MTQSAFGTVAAPSRRAVAYIIDTAIAAGIGIVLTTLLVVFAVSAGPDGMLGVLTAGAVIVWLLMLGWFIVYTIMQSGNGSIGMRAQGLRLVREADGAPLGFGRALVRNIVFGLAASIVVGYFTPLFDGSGRYQGWHDKAGRSLMTDSRARSTTVGMLPEQDVRVPPRPPMPNSGRAFPGLETPSVAPTASMSEPFPSATNYAAPEYTAPEAPAFPAAPAPAFPAAPAPAFPAAPAPAAPITHPDAPAAGGDSLIAFVPGITQDGPPARAASAPEPVAPAPASPVAPAQAQASAPIPAPGPGEISDIEDTRISIPGHRLVFTWDDGTRVTVSRRALFGRNPSPEDGAAVVPVRDETLSLSKTHFEAAAEASGGWIMDRHSTNGTVIVREGHRIVCEPGEQVRIRLGDAIEIGDRIVTVGGYA